MFVDNIRNSGQCNWKIASKITVGLQVEPLCEGLTDKAHRVPVRAACKCLNFSDRHLNIGSELDGFGQMGARFRAITTLIGQRCLSPHHFHVLHMIHRPRI